MLAVSIVKGGSRVVYCLRNGIKSKQFVRIKVINETVRRVGVVVSIDMQVVRRYRTALPLREVIPCGALESS